MADHTRDEAYRLRGPAAHAEYYDQWAPTYDADFVQATGYLAPTEVARVFREVARASDDPVADVGCGTGALGVALLGSGHVVDGLDISPGMLEQAERTGAYRAGVIADLSGPAVPGGGTYGAVVSSGTFTLGHLGPTSLPAVLDLLRPGGLCVLGVNARHFADAGFAPAFAALAVAGRIGPVELRTVATYADPVDPGDLLNRARVVILRTSA